MRVDAFIDLTGSALSPADVEAAITRWRHADQLGAIVEHATIVTRPSGPMPAGPEPSDWSITASSTPAAVLNTALEGAGRRGAALLILSGKVDVGSEALNVLRQGLEQDPMFGFSIPRVSCRDRCCISQLTRNGLGAAAWLPRRVLAEIPETQLLVETASPCVLVSPQVTGNFGPLEPAAERLPSAMLRFMAAARRCGFRTVACNRAVVSLPDLECDPTAGKAPPVPSVDVKALARAIPDLERSWTQFGGASAERFESLYAALPHPRSPAARPSLLMDLRNVAPVHNGTSHAILGVVAACRELAGHWTISLLATPEGAGFHRLKERFAEWPLYTTVPDRAFTVAFRPSQPWHLQEMADLHGAALVNAYLVLDTIAWDVAYCAPPHLDGVWQFLATYADGLLYDSDFTRRRFLARFPAGAAVPDAVTHFSFDPAEYLDATAASQTPDGGYILVVGNQLDHKDVRLTTRTLATAFPYREIQVLGPTDVVSPCVTAHPSGALTDHDIHRLYSGARCIVYPSFYEGFGFPLVTALAYGRTVVVRRSPLVDELAPLCHGGGRLLIFDRREELVELIGRLMAGDVSGGLPLAGPQNGPPRRWRDVAWDTHHFLTALIQGREPGRWMRRDQTIRQMVAYRE